jgi:hypothetical protein
MTSKGKQTESEIAKQLLDHLPLLDLNAESQCDKQALSKQLVADDKN